MKHLSYVFYKFQLSSLLSQLAFRCLQLSIAWWVLDKSAEASTYAMVISISTFVELFSRILFAWLGDRYNKFSIFRYSTIGNLVALIALSVLSHLGIYNIYLIGLFVGLIGVTLGIRSPIEASAISQLVETKNIDKAIQVKNVAYSIANVCGPAIGGLLISFNGTDSALIAGTMLVFFSMLLVPNLNKRVKAAASDQNTNAMGSVHASQATHWLAETYQGIRLVYVVKAEFFLALVAMIINFCLFPFFTILIPVLVKDTLKLDAWYIGLLDGSFSIGILLGSLYYVDVMKRMVGKVHSASLGIITLGLSMIACATIANLYFVAPIMFLGGIGLMLFNINVAVPRLIATPEKFKNRMVASVSFFSAAINPVGTYFSGISVDQIGIESTLLLASGIIFMASGLLYYSKDLKKVLSLNDAKLKNHYAQMYPKAFN